MDKAPGYSTCQEVTRRRRKRYSMIVKCYDEKDGDGDCAIYVLFVSD
jgi:hypothetical protein